MAKINIQSNINDLSNRFQSFQSLLAGGVTNALKGVRVALTAISTHPIIAVITVITTLFIALGNQLSKLQTVVDALDKAMLVLRQSFDFIITEIGAFLGLTESTGKSLAQVVREAQALADAKVALAEATIVATTQQAELRVQLSEYRAVAADATKTEEERIEALENAQRVNEELFASQRMLLEEEIRLLEIEQSAGETSREERQRLADLQARLIQLNADENNANRELIATKSGLQKQIEAKAEADRKEAEAIRLKNEQLAKEARFSEQARQLSEVDRQIQLDLANGFIDEAQARMMKITAIEALASVEEDEERRAELLEQAKQLRHENEIIRINEEVAAEEKAAQDRKRIAEQEQKAREAVTDARIGSIGAIGDALTTLAGENKGLAIAGLIIEQGAAVAGIITDTIRASVAALRPPPTGLGPVAGVPLATAIQVGGAASVASAIAATVQGINAIKSAPGPAASGAAGGGGASAVNFGPTAATPRTSGVQGAAGQGGASQVQFGQMDNTIMAVVAEGDIQSSTERAARTRNKRRFGNG